MKADNYVGNPVSLRGSFKGIRRLVLAEINEAEKVFEGLDSLWEKQEAILKITGI